MSDLSVAQTECPEALLRRTQTVELAQVARGLGSLTGLVRIEWPNNLEGRNRYDDLAEALARPVSERCQEQLGDARMENPAYFGAVVVSRTLGYAPAAYSRFCAEQRQAVDLADLGAILRRSSHTPASLATMKRPTAMLYEEGLGIRDFMPDYANGGGFAVTLHDDGLAYYEAESTRLASIERDVERKKQSGDIEPQQPHERCPAPLIIRQMWEAGIDTCLTDPNLFAADLAA